MFMPIGNANFDTYGSWVVRSFFIYLLTKGMESTPLVLSCSPSSMLISPVYWSSYFLRSPSSVLIIFHLAIVFECVTWELFYLLVLRQPCNVLERKMKIASHIFLQAIETKQSIWSQHSGYILSLEPIDCWYCNL